VALSVWHADTHHADADARQKQNSGGPKTTAVRFSGDCWQEIEALPQPVRWAVQRVIFHLLEEPVPTLADPFPRMTRCPGLMSCTCLLTA